MTDKNNPTYSDISIDYIDHMGTDLTVVNAARVSFDKESQWDFGSWEEYNKDPEKWIYNSQEAPTGNFRKLCDQDAKLINYLAKHNHWSPFGHCQAQFRIKAPIFLARQLVKHQVGLVWNEVSRRYVDTPPEFYSPETWRGRPVGSMKQGSNDDIEITELLAPTICVDMVLSSYSTTNNLSKLFNTYVGQSLSLYNSMVDSGVAPEQARMILPQNMMVEWYWTGSLYAWARVYNLRSKPTAQKEARDFAALLDAEINHLFPISWKALTQYTPSTTN